MIETLVKSTMVLLFAGATPIAATDPSIWCQWGLAGIVVAYVLWHDQRRERRMATAIESQQKWIRETLVQTLERNAAAMERMISWLEDHEEEVRHDHHR